MISKVLPIVIAAALSVAAIVGAIQTDVSNSIDSIEMLVADNPRKDRRDDRQERRPDRRDDRQDCRQDEGRVGQDKRECKQEDRGEGDDDEEGTGNA